MPTAPLEVDTEVYLGAAGLFVSVNAAACDAVAAAATAAGGGAGMAGTDSEGAGWAKDYDAAASGALSAGSSLADSLGRIGDLLSATGANHADAETASVPVTNGGAAAPSAYSGTPGSRASGVVVCAPPSADGTPGDTPPGWFLVAHLVGMVWPNGHQGQLREVASGWSNAATELQDQADRLSPGIGEISAQRSPEVDAAVATCCQVQLSMRSLATAYGELGTACAAYADHLDEAHHEAIHELESLVAQEVAIQAAGAVLAVFTAGAAEVAAQAAAVARAAATALKVGTILRRLGELVRALGATVRAVGTRIRELLTAIRSAAHKGVVTTYERIAPISMLTPLSQLQRLYGAGVPRATELRAWASRQGWHRSRTVSGPEVWTDQRGISRLTIKLGSDRSPGSELPHAAFRDANDKYMNPLNGELDFRKSPTQHLLIIWD